ncbi:MAG: hypothetical protein ABW252_11735 [Polyangiales bacterium]
MSNLAGLVRALRDRRDWVGAALVALVAAHAAVVVATGVSPDVARWCMKRFHLGTSGFAAWASYQLGPWMYNFDNQVLLSPRPLRPDELDAQTAFFHLNHQSARVFTFADHRGILFATPGDHFIYLRSRYREAEVVSAFRIHVYPESRPYRATVFPLGSTP